MNKLRPATTPWGQAIELLLARHYGVRLWRHGRSRTWKGFERKSDARAWYEDRRKDIREHRAFPDDQLKPAALTIDELFAAYNETARTKKNYRGELEYLAFWKGALKPPTPAASVKPLTIERIRTRLLTRGITRGALSPATVNRYVAWLHHVYRWGIDRELVTVNPCRLFVTSPKKGGAKLPEPPPPEQTWTDTELDALSEELGAQILVPLLALLTGLRRGEQFSLQKDRLNLEKGFGYLDDPKAGEPQIVYFNDDAIKILRYLIAQSGESPFVLPSPRWPMRRHRNAQSWYADVFTPAAIRAGLTIGRKHGKTWHTLRHSYANRLLDLKVHIKDVQDAGRWESWQAMMRYLKTRKDRVHAAVQLLKSPIDLADFIGTATKSTLTRKRKSERSVSH